MRIETLPDGRTRIHCEDSEERVETYADPTEAAVRVAYLRERALIAAVRAGRVRVDPQDAEAAALADAVGATRTRAVR